VCVLKEVGLWCRCSKHGEVLLDTVEEKS
jgi:hypothetical protein